MIQYRLLYRPAKARLADLVSDNLQAWPGPEDFRGLMAEPPGRARATALVFHGNTGHAGHRDHYAAALLPLGLRVILAEYPGYGPRTGGLGEESLVTDAEAAIALAQEHYGSPLLVIGESLGTGVAAAASAGQRDKVTGLMLITPWDRLENVAAHHYPQLALKWFLHDRYDSATHLASFARPTLVVLAERDRVVPARLGQALFEAMSGPKSLAIIREAQHSDWPGRVGQDWWQQAADFLLGEKNTPEPV